MTGNAAGHDHDESHGFVSTISGLIAKIIRLVIMSVVTVVGLNTLNDLDKLPFGIRLSLVNPRCEYPTQPGVATAPYKPGELFKRKGSVYSRYSCTPTE